MKDTKTNIELNYEGEHYTLGFTASSIKKMEQRGFKFGKLDDIPLTAPLELFCGSFIANHPNVSRKKREEIFDNLCGNSENGDDLMEVLSNMVSEAVEELNTHQGNVTWSVQ